MRMISYAIWIILATFVIDGGCKLLNQPSTIANIVGFLLLVLFTIFSIKSECLTKFIKKNEK